MSEACKNGFGWKFWNKKNRTSKKISPKYTKNREPNEETINILKIQYPELKDFFEQTFNDGLKKYINGYYDSMYENPADNKYLFSQLKIDEKEKEIWKRLIDEDLYDYFLKKKGRKTIDKEDWKRIYSLYIYLIPNKINI